jgi:hypothetical protein
MNVVHDIYIYKLITNLSKQIQSRVETLTKSCSQTLSSWELVQESFATSGHVNI